MKYEKSLTINLGNYSSLKIGCTEAESFEEIDEALRKELMVSNVEAPQSILNCLKV